MTSHHQMRHKSQRRSRVLSKGPSITYVHNFMYMLSRPPLPLFFAMQMYRKLDPRLLPLGVYTVNERPLNGKRSKNLKNDLENTIAFILRYKSDKITGFICILHIYSD